MTVASTHAHPAQAGLPRYLTLADAAKVMSVSVKTVRRRIADGTIPAYQCGRTTLRIRLEDIEKAMRRVPSARS